MRLSLSDVNQTAALGRILAQGLKTLGPCPLLISGPLGAGKTTLIRHIVANLPGGDQAEVSSPSFNLVNIYPTQPEVVHMDLYRLGPAGLDESLAEYFESETAALLVEWAEYVPAGEEPPDFMRIHLHIANHGREALLSAHGKKAGSWILHVFEDKKHLFGCAPRGIRKEL